MESSLLWKKTGFRSRPFEKVLFRLCRRLNSQIVIDVHDAVSGQFQYIIKADGHRQFFPKNIFIIATDLQLPIYGIDAVNSASDRPVTAQRSVCPSRCTGYGQPSILSFEKAYSDRHPLSDLQELVRKGSLIFLRKFDFRNPQMVLSSAAISSS